MPDTSTLPPMSEDALLKLVLGLAKVFGWRSVHFRQARVKRRGKWTYRTPVQGDGKGFPDAVLCRPGHGDVRGRVIFCELKSDAGRLTKEQEEWRWALLAAGAEYYCWTPRDLEEIERTLGG